MIDVICDVMLPEERDTEKNRDVPRCIHCLVVRLVVHLSVRFFRKRERKQHRKTSINQVCESTNMCCSTLSTSLWLESLCIQLQ